MHDVLLTLRFTVRNWLNTLRDLFVYWVCLLGDNYNIMISTQNGAENENDAYNVIPTLLAMGLSANVTKDVQRHIVRAIDNLSAQGTF